MINLLYIRCKYTQKRSYLFVFLSKYRFVKFRFRNIRNFLTIFIIMYLENTYICG